MKQLANDPRYRQALAEDEGNNWRANRLAESEGWERDLVAANRAAFIAEWQPVFAARRAAWNGLLISRPELTIPQREAMLGFTLAHLILAKEICA